jgi:mRNA interferase MazF
MPSSEGLAAFDIIVVPFPCSDRLAEKRRPALIISSPALRPLGVVWVAMITSAENEPWTCDVPISDLTRAGLPAPSVIRVAKIACIEPARVLRLAGRLDNKTARKVSGQLRQFLGRA